MKQNPETKKKTMGRRKIEIKPIENKNSLQVTFCKRRTGIFKKAGELGLLTGAQIAIIMKSRADKMYTFSNVGLDSVLNGFVTGSTPFFEPDSRRVQERRSEYEEASWRLRMEESRKIGVHGLQARNWWDDSVEGFSEYELEEYLEALEGLKGKVLKRVEEIEKLRLVEGSGLNFEVGECSSNLTGFGDGPVCGYGDDWQGRSGGLGFSDQHQENRLIQFEDLNTKNMNMDAGGSSSSNVINSPEHQNSENNGCLEDIFDERYRLTV